MNTPMPATASKIAASAIAPQAPRILVIGYGNPGRQDDGLGPAAANAIEGLDWPNLSTIDNYQLAIEDAIDIAGHDVIWFVDASCVSGMPCAIRRLSPAFDISFTSHLLKPETLLAITAQQFGMSPKAYLVSIRGYDFDFYEGLSGRAAGNLAIAVAVLRRRIGHLLKVS